MATNAHYRSLTAREFLGIDFGTDMKAELDNGVIRMMAGGTRAHSRVQMNLYRHLGNALRGSGCRPHGSDMAVQVGDHSVRYPDVTIDCGSPTDTPRDLILSDPRVIVEILSPSTRDIDLGVKLGEYRSLIGIEAVVFIDPDQETIAVTHRTPAGGWTDIAFVAETDVALPSLQLDIPYAEIFAQD